MLAFDEGTAAPAADVARLHEALLPQSPIPLLGREFMERFYYSVLPQEGSIRGAVAYVDNQAAGFIVVTHDAAGFMRAALRRHWARIGWLIGTSVLLSPKRIAYVWEALQVMRSAPPPAAEAGAVGQILSFGVLPTYRDFGFVRRTGLKIGVDLLKRGILALEARGVREIRAAVETQNLEAQLFYRGQGFRLTRTHLPGWRVSAVELAWRSDGLKV
jgi:ribosomal protein S18 acetylase RimI-like enzyme